MRDFSILWINCGCTYTALMMLTAPWKKRGLSQDTVIPDTKWILKVNTACFQQKERKRNLSREPEHPGLNKVYSQGSLACCSHRVAKSRIPMRDWTTLRTHLTRAWSALVLPESKWPTLRESEPAFQQDP